METLRINSNATNVEIIVNDDKAINGTKRIDIRKTNVVKLRLVDNPETLDMIKIHYVNGDSDELHFSRVTTINNQTVTDNLDLYNKLKVLFDA